jgi:beta-N-acetylhexosaminidase
LAPYRELRNELPMVMVNHAAYPDTPGKNRPASGIVIGLLLCCASGSAIGNYLLRRLGDGRHSEVHADRRGRGRGDSRGMDLLEICHSPELILRAYEALIAEGERSAAFSQESALLRGLRADFAARAKLFAGKASGGAFREAIRGAARSGFCASARRRRPTRIGGNPHEREDQ